MPCTSGQWESALNSAPSFPRVARQHGRQTINRVHDANNLRAQIVVRHADSERTHQELPQT